MFIYPKTTITLRNKKIAESGIELFNKKFMLITLKKKNGLPGKEDQENNSRRLIILSSTNRNTAQLA